MVWITGTLVSSHKIKVNYFPVPVFLDVTYTFTSCCKVYAKLTSDSSNAKMQIDLIEKWKKS